jgi:hypothetical protein
MAVLAMTTTTVAANYSTIFVKTSYHILWIFIILGFIVNLVAAFLVIAVFSNLFCVASQVPTTQ